MGLPCDICGEDLGDDVPYQQKRHKGACHKEFERRRVAAGRKSGKYRGNYAPKGPWRGIRTCRFCGEDFEAKSPKAEVCYGKDCQNAKNAERAKKFRKRYSEENGRSYEMRYAEQRRDAFKARRAKVLGATVGEPFSAREVFDRDEWTCRLCGEGIDKWRRFPDPWSASVDHIVPVSRGGAHSLDNVQASHLSCNARKCNRLAA